MLYICTIQWMFTTTTTFPVTVSELMGQTLYVQWFSCSYYIPYSIQITILIFQISACIYQCISNRWKKLHQLIMETVQGRSILDINKGIWTPALTKNNSVGIANRCFPNQNIFKESKISESSFHFFSSECYVWPTELIIYLSLFYTFFTKRSK